MIAYFINQFDDEKLLLSDKTNDLEFAPSEDLNHPGHPLSLIRVFVVHTMGS